MKSNKKIILLLVLSIFLVGMLMGTATASHTYKCGKYKITVSDSQYKKLKKAKKGSSYQITKNTGKYQTYKVPKYTTKKVTTYKWQYKKVLQTKMVYSKDWSDSTIYDYNVDKYFKNGWKFYGSTTTEENNGHVWKYYAKFKKKVKVTQTKKVKAGYTTKKTPIKIRIGADLMDGAYIYVFSEWYNNGYNSKTYASKLLNI